MPAGAERDVHLRYSITITSLPHEAIAEISPQIRDLLYAALERRPPWTWEPERSGTAGGLDPIRAEFRESVAQATERAILRAAEVDPEA